MDTRRRTVTLVLAVGLGLAVQSVASSATRPPIRIHGASARQMAMVRWAVGRYRLAGLPLPSLDIEFRANGACGLDWAYYVREQRRIVDCDPWWRSESRETLLHELAHAWDQLALTDEVRRRFMAFRGLDSWRGAGTPWARRGAEQTAEIVAWGLMDDGLPELTARLTKIFDMRAEDLPVAFEMLTGRKPVHPAAFGGTQP
jgi:hypothetical protein